MRLGHASPPQTDRRGASRQLHIHADVSSDLNGCALMVAPDNGRHKLKECIQTLHNAL